MLVQQKCQAYWVVFHINPISMLNFDSRYSDIDNKKCFPIAFAFSLPISGISVRWKERIEEQRGWASRISTNHQGRWQAKESKGTTKPCTQAKHVSSSYSNVVEIGLKEVFVAIFIKRIQVQTGKVTAFISGNYMELLENAPKPSRWKWLWIFAQIGKKYIYIC